MTALYRKNKLNFALLWIGIYLVSAMAGDALSEAAGIQKAATAPVLLALSLYLLFWLRKEGLTRDHGLRPVTGKGREYLWFLPLVLMVTVNLWGGVEMNMSPAETGLYIVSMLCVGFLEELIFRGFLFTAMRPQGLKTAILVSSLTFGMGHILNLLNGAEVFATVLQIGYACAVGLLFTVLFYKSGSLVPCMVTHGVFNSLSAFGAEMPDRADALTALALMVLSLGYAGWIWKKGK